MHDLSLIAASTWAHAHASSSYDPVKFGHNVALAYLACRDTQYHAGDKKATAAALAALSIPLEVLQRLEQVSSLLIRPTLSPSDQKAGVGA